MERNIAFVFPSCMQLFVFSNYRSIKMSVWRLSVLAPFLLPLSQVFTWYFDNLISSVSHCNDVTSWSMPCLCFLACMIILKHYIHPNFFFFFFLIRKIILTQHLHCKTWHNVTGLIVLQNQGKRCQLIVYGIIYGKCEWFDWVLLHSWVETWLLNSY